MTLGAVDTGRVGGVRGGEVGGKEDDLLDLRDGDEDGDGDRLGGDEKV